MRKEAKGAESLVVKEAPIEYAELGDVDESVALEPLEAAPIPEVNQAPLLPMEAAVERIGKAVLDHFKEQFNGKPSGMRHVDTKDRIFENEIQ